VGKYGSSAMSAEITIPNFDKYLEKIQMAGNDIDALCEKAINAALPTVESAMKAGAARHRKGIGRYGTDAAYNAIESNPAKESGNYIYGTVGINMDKHPEAINAIYQEYGDGHSPEFPDPFIRPAFDGNKNEIKKIERDVLKKGGIPIE